MILKGGEKDQREARSHVSGDQTSGRGLDLREDTFLIVTAKGKKKAERRKKRGKQRRGLTICGSNRRGRTRNHIARKKKTPDQGQGFGNNVSGVRKAGVKLTNNTPRKINHRGRDIELGGIRKAGNAEGTAQNVKRGGVNQRRAAGEAAPLKASRLGAVPTEGKGAGPMRFGRYALLSWMAICRS